jgi:hypothetical protein
MCAQPLEVLTQILTATTLPVLFLKLFMQVGWSPRWFESGPPLWMSPLARIMSVLELINDCMQVVTREGRVMLMEYGYDGRTMEMFSRFGVDQSQEQYLMWLVKTLVLPAAYW